MAIRFGRVVRVALAVCTLVLIGLPAAASHTPAHTTDEIWSLVAETEAAIDDVVDDFEATVSSMVDPGEVEAAEATAKADIDAIWREARNGVDDLAKLYKGLGQDAGTAKQQLQEHRNQRRSEVTALADAWIPAAPTTTSTTVTTATTTTTITTSTTHPDSGVTPGPPTGGNGNGSGNGNGNGPGGGNGNGNHGGQGQIDPPAPSPPDAPGSPDIHVDPDPTDNISTDGVQESVDAAGLGFVPQTPGIAVAQGMSPASGAFGNDEAALSSQVSTVLETVLPPAIVEVVLSPLLVLEILARTIMADAQKILIPLSLLALCALVIAFGDRFHAGSSRLIAYIRR